MSEKEPPGGHPGGGRQIGALDAGGRRRPVRSWCTVRGASSGG
jgi:hypothetical protein